MPCHDDLRPRHPSSREKKRLVIGAGPGWTAGLVSWSVAGLDALSSRRTTNLQVFVKKAFHQKYRQDVVLIEEEASISSSAGVIALLDESGGLAYHPGVIGGAKRKHTLGWRRRPTRHGDAWRQDEIRRRMYCRRARVVAGICSQMASVDTLIWLM